MGWKIFSWVNLSDKANIYAYNSENTLIFNTYRPGNIVYRVNEPQKLK